MKICSRCGIEKEMGAFYVNKLMKDGRTQYCKDCMYVPKIGRHGDVELRRARREVQKQRKAELAKAQRLEYGVVRRKIPEAERFWARVEKVEEGCWLWKGYCDKQKRARFSLSITGVTIPAARWIWAQENGPIPEGKMICHKCDNPACVRPDHLFLGDAQSNVDDMISKGRAAWQKC